MASLPRLLIATGNAHKTGEFRSLLAGLVLVEDLSVHPGLPQVEENASSFEGNSAIKALAAARATGCPALADDSGLEVDELGGEPGVRSARYAGPGATDVDNRHRLLSELAARAGAGKPSARFRCVLTLALPDGRLFGPWSGAVEGHLIREERGEGGFGYDALFVPDGYYQTFAELPAGVKNQLSHRGKAVASFVDECRSGLLDKLTTAPR